MPDLGDRYHLRWPPFSGFSLSLATSRSALGDTSAEAFFTDGIASMSTPILGVHPLTTVRSRLDVVIDSLKLFKK